MPILPAELLPLIVEFAPLFSRPVCERAKVSFVGPVLATGNRVLNRARCPAVAASQIQLHLLVTAFTPKGDLIRAEAGVPKSKPKASSQVAEETQEACSAFKGAVCALVSRGQPEIASGLESQIELWLPLKQH